MSLNLTRYELFVFNQRNGAANVKLFDTRGQAVAEAHRRNDRKATKPGQFNSKLWKAVPYGPNRNCLWQVVEAR